MCLGGNSPELKSFERRSNPGEEEGESPRKIEWLGRRLGSRRELEIQYEPYV